MYDSKTLALGIEKGKRMNPAENNPQMESKDEPYTLLRDSSSNSFYITLGTLPVSVPFVSADIVCVSGARDTVQEKTSTVPRGNLGTVEVFMEENFEKKESFSGKEPFLKSSEIGASDYQLAFFTPGMRPLAAISRNWIREIPKRRIKPLGRPVMLQRL